MGFQGFATTLTVLSWAVFLVQPVGAQSSETLTLSGLEQRVEIVKDVWGISHIYAQTEHDLFFAQGYSAARDRLFQFEIWRAQATGTTAEFLGPRAVARDHGTRLFKFRGDLNQEMNHYHDRGTEIIPAFVDGVNAYIDQALANPDHLPLPFRLLGIEPKRWTPEVVISRHQGLLGQWVRPEDAAAFADALEAYLPQSEKEFGKEDADPIKELIEFCRGGGFIIC